MKILKTNNPYSNKNTYFRNDRSDKKNYNMPLKNSINFKGLFNYKLVNTIFPAKVKKIPHKLDEQAVELLKRKSDNLANLYTGFRDAFLDRIKTNDNFRLKLGISDKTLEKIKADKDFVIAIPEQNLAKKFIDNVFAPLKIVTDTGSMILNSRLGKWLATKSNFINNLVQKNQDKIKDAEILHNYKSYTGLIDSIKIWETKQRKLAGLSAWDESKDLISSTKVLEGKALRRWLKSVDPTKGKYQTKHQMLGNRLISGLVYGTFLGNDAYNTTIRYSDDKKEANTQRRARFSQELAKIGINMYLINLFIGTFEKYVNKSLFHAIFMACATTMTSEILGRKLVGRPIFPSDKETLDKMTKEMEEKKGFWVGVGRLITGIRPKTKKHAKKPLFVLTEEKKRPSFNKLNIKNETPQTEKIGFKGKNKKQISFGSFYKIPQMMNPENTDKILQLIKKADPKIHSNFIKIINKSLSDITSEAKNLNSYLTSKEMIPIGTKKTWYGNFIKSLISPYFFVKNTGNSIVSSIKRAFSKTGTANNLEDMEIRLKKLKKQHPNIEDDFNKFFKKVSNSKLWKESSFDEKTKRVKLLAEYLDGYSKGNEEIEGVKNILLYLNKNLKNKEINEENIKTVKDTLYKNFMKTDGAAHVEYDGNTFAMMNINLSRLIATMFLVVDAYNLSMQYSNNDKTAAINNGKSRALQEASRITVSAYMLAFVHNLLSKFCNSSLFGAFTTTAVTSSLNDTLARKVVGVPLGTKTHEQILEIDKENAKSKSPLKRMLAYLIGKRQRPKTKNESYSNYSLSITKPFEMMLK